MRSNPSNIPQKSKAPQNGAAVLVTTNGQAQGQAVPNVAAQAEGAAQGPQNPAQAMWVMGPDGRPMLVGPDGKVLTPKPRRRRGTTADGERQDEATDAQAAPRSDAEHQDPASAGSDELALDLTAPTPDALSMPEWASETLSTGHDREPVLLAQAPATVVTDAAAPAAASSSAVPAPSGAESAAPASSATEPTGTTAGTVEGVSAAGALVMAGGILAIVVSNDDSKSPTPEKSLQNDDSKSPTPEKSLQLANDTGTSDSDGISNDGTINLKERDAGSAWEYSTDGGSKWITGTNSGSFSLAEGTYDIGQVQVKQITSGLKVLVKNAMAFVIDQTPPADPSVSFSDSGSSDDRITNLGTMTVSGLEAGATWQYSSDEGNSWANGQGSSFILGQANKTVSYAENQVQVRQIDAAGNTGPARELAAFIIDQSVDTPTLSLSSDSGSSESDGISNVGSMTVGGLEEGRSWQYSSNGGSSWTPGTGSSFSLPAGSYAANAVQVKQTDLVGNVATGKNARALSIDASAHAPTLVLATDSGSSASDGLSNVGIINVTGLEDGATWQYRSDGGGTWATGSGNSFTLPAGSYDANAVQVQQTDAAGNESRVGFYTKPIRIDLSVDPPSLALARYIPNGSVWDTNDGTVNISGLESGASWQYSTNSGNTWVSGSGSSFSLAANTTYAANAVQVRQTDAAGNSAVGKISNAINNSDSVTLLYFGLSQDTGASSSDGLSNDGSVRVYLVDPAVRWDYSTNGGSDWTEVPDDNGTVGTSFSLAADSYAAGQVRIKQTINNVALIAQNAGPLVIDQTAPADPSASFSDAGSSSDDRITNLGTMTVSGLEAGATWQYSSDEGNSWANGQGNSFILGEANKTVSYADNQVQVRQIDAAGNTGSASQLAAFTIDQSVDTPTLTLDYDSGSSNDDGISHDGSMTVGGLEDGATWAYSSNGGSSWTPGTGGSFSLPAGSYAANAVQVKQTDLVGNVATGKNAHALVIDTSVSAPTLVLVTDSGSSASDGISNVGTINVTGLEAGATWQYSSDGGDTWTTGSGNSFSLPAGSYDASSLRVQQTDTAGNESPVGMNAKLIHIDQSVAMPSLALARYKPNGSVWDTNDGTVNISGLETGAAWQYSTNSGNTWFSGSGSSFSLAANTSYAANAVQVRQTDAAGNSSAVGQNSNAINNNDSVTLLYFGLSQDTGSSSSDGISYLGTVSVTLVDTGAAWEYSTNAGTAWTTVSPANGTVGTSFSLGAGTYAANQVQVRQSGVVAKNAGALNIDQTAPADPSVSFSDAGSSSDDRITNLGTMTVSGLEAGATWQYSSDEGNSWANGQGNSFILGEANKTVSYADNQVQVRQIDAAGNTGSASQLAAFTIDQSVDTPTLTLANDSGNSESDWISIDGTMTVGGLEDRGSWQYSTNGGGTWTTGSGSSFSLPAGSYAANAVQVKQTDLVGNVATGKNARALSIDASAHAPTLVLATDSGSSASDGISNVGTINVSGLENGASWLYSLDGSNGTWFTGTGNSFSLPAGSYDASSLQVQQTDAAGNESPVGMNAKLIHIDQSVAMPSLALARYKPNGSVWDTNDGTVNISGLETGAAWQYSTNSGNTWVSGSGSSFSLAANTTYAANAVQVRQTDAAGNSAVGKISNAINNSDSVTLLYFGLSQDTGASSSDGLSNDGSVRVYLVDPAVRWDYSTNGGSDWTEVPDDNGTVGTSFSLAAGSYAAGQVRIKQSVNGVDLGAQNAGPLVIDQTAPADLSVSFSDAGSSSDDRITNLGTVTVSGLEAGATWQYSTDGGAHWSTPALLSSVSTFSLGDGSYADNAVQVRQSDAAGNSSQASDIGLALTVDSRAPTLVSASAVANKLTLTFSEPLENAVGMVPTASDFSLSDNNTITQVAVSGSTVVLTLGTAYANGQANFNTTVSYTNGADGTDIQDVAGNEVAGFSGRALTNDTPARPTISAGVLAGVNNLDVRSKIVLSLNDGDLTPVAGKTIRIVNDGGTYDQDDDPGTPNIGYRSELMFNDIVIDVATGATTVKIQAQAADGTRTGDVTSKSPTAIMGSISTDTSIITLDAANKKLIIDPCIDLDFANSYHIEVDEGAFTNVAGASNAAIDSPSAIGFSTVLPHQTTSANNIGNRQGTLSRTMTTQGLQDSYAWVDLSDRGTPTADLSPTNVFNAGVKKYAFVMQDISDIADVNTLDFNVRVYNFGQDDLVYIDSQGDGYLVDTSVPITSPEDRSTIGAVDAGWQYELATDNVNVSAAGVGALTGGTTRAALAYLTGAVQDVSDAGGTLALSLDPAIPNLIDPALPERDSIGDQDTAPLSIVDFNTKLNGGTRPVLPEGSNFLDPNLLQLYVVLG